jgi:hypothetical protein
MGQEKGRLSPLVLPPTVLYETLSKINSSAKDRGEQMLQLNAYSYPYTMLVNDTRVEIIIHVNIVDRYFHLFRFHSLPYWHNDTYMRIISTENYIAVAQQEDTRGVLLMQAELDACTHHMMPDNGLWVCANRVILRSVFDTCIGRVFSGKPHKDTCRYEYAKEVDEAFLINAGSLVVFEGASDHESWQYCKNSTVQNRVKVDHGKILHVNKGCKVVLAKAEYTAFEDYVVKMQYGLPLAQRVRLQMPEKHRDIIKELLESMPKISSDAVNFHYEQRKLNRIHSWTFGTGLTILATLTLVAIVAYVWSYFRYKKKQRRQGNRLEDQPLQEILE